MLKNSAKVIGTLCIALGLTVGVGCAGKKVSLNQMPISAQAKVDEHVRGGHIHHIHSKTSDGMLFYDVEYSRAGNRYEIRVDEHGEVIEKKI